MALISWVYLVILVVALGTTIGLRFMVKLYAAVNWWRRGFYLLIAVLSGVIGWLTGPHDANGWMSNLFIIGMFIVFAFWPKGLSHQAVIAGLGSTRPLSAVTQVTLEAVGPAQSRMLTQVGTIVVSRLMFNQTTSELQQTLQPFFKSEQIHLKK